MWTLSVGKLTAVVGVELPSVSLGALVFGLEVISSAVLEVPVGFWVRLR